MSHFRDAGAGAAGTRGLVVLDRDHHGAGEDLLHAEPGLELFTWGRRHIESYVLVPAAIRRLLARGPDAGRFDRLIEDHVPEAHDEEACRRVDAKRLLGHKGPIARGCGRPLSPGDIARCMRADELHPDVMDLFRRILDSLGLAVPAPIEVVRRPGQPS